MPIIIPQDLPASEILKSEEIFVMDEKRAKTQDIRPLEMAIINLMPTKIQTETQLLRMISNTALQVNIDLIKTKTYSSKNTSQKHLEKFYVTMEEVKNKKYDAMIITGAPVEHLKFEDVEYWEELETMLDFARTNVYSTMFICWASQAALHYYYGLDKYELDEKLFGVFEVELNKKSLITSGFDETFFVPHSRHTTINEKDIENIEDIDILAKSDEVGVHMAATKDKRFIFITGHGEYDTNTLEDEYKRDINKGLDIAVPKNYYKNNNPDDKILVKWKAHNNLLFSNWLNLCVYQDTEYDIDKISEKKI